MNKAPVQQESTEMDTASKAPFQPKKLQLNKKQIQFPQAINNLLFVGVGLIAVYLFRHILGDYLQVIGVLFGGSSGILNWPYYVAGVVAIILYIILISMVSIKALRVEYTATRTAAILMLVSLALSIVTIILQFVLLSMALAPFAFIIVVRIMQVVDILLKTVTAIFGIVIYVEYSIDRKVSKKIFQWSIWLTAAAAILVVLSIAVSAKLGFFIIDSISYAIYAFMLTMILWRVYRMKSKVALVFMWIGFTKQAVWLVLLAVLALIQFQGKTWGILGYQTIEAAQTYWLDYLENVILLLTFLSMIICTAVATRIKINRLNEK